MFLIDRAFLSKKITRKDWFVAAVPPMLQVKKSRSRILVLRLEHDLKQNIAAHLRSKLSKIQIEIAWKPCYIEIEVFKLLLVNVPRKEVVFAKAIPIRKVCMAGGDAEPTTVRSAREKGKPGRKRSAAKEEDEQLVKKIKLGNDVERNERQMKNLGGNEQR